MRRLLILLLLASFRGCCASTFSLDNENSNASRSSESSVAVAAPFCKDIAVESRAKEFRIPWFAKEHYIEVNEAASAIVCVIGLSPLSSSRRILSNSLVEWLYYPEYMNLDTLKKDYERVHSEGLESTLLEQPCRLPVSNQVPSLLGDNKIGVCKETHTRSIAITVVKRKSGTYESHLTFHRASPSSSGTYQCRWRWAHESACLVKEELFRRDRYEVRNLLGHSRRRSATIYVKVYELQSYLKELFVVFAASTFLSVILLILWCMDSHLRTVNKTHLSVEYHF